MMVILSKKKDNTGYAKNLPVKVALCIHKLNGVFLLHPFEEGIYILLSIGIQVALHKLLVHYKMCGIAHKVHLYLIP